MPSSQSPHKAVILDGYALNPGDLSWEPLRALVPDLTVYDRTPPGQVLERCEGTDIVLVNKTVLDAAAINALPRLRYIGVLATGYNVVDISAAHARGIAVTNVPAYSTSSVAQQVFAFLLSFTNEVDLHAAGVRDGRWTRSADFCYWDSPLTELDGLVLGVVGYGRIGRRVAQIARAFGMRVLVSTRTPRPDEDGITFVSLDDLFRLSDVITLHCPLTAETEHLVNARRLALVKPTAILINTGRGPLVDEQALADALNADRIRGAGLDVLSREPPQADNPLLSARNCRITPHVSWATFAARTRLMDVATGNVAAFLDGTPRNLV